MLFIITPMPINLDPIQEYGLMNRIKAFTNLLFIVFLISCRNDLTDLHQGTGVLTVSISVDRSLYQGEYIQDRSGRFVGPSSSSMTLTYTTGGQDFSTTVDIALSKTGTSVTGTAILENLPTGVEGTVKATTFDTSGAILCEGLETMTLSSGENKTTLTLGISKSSPYLSVTQAAQFLDKVLSSGKTLFVQVEGLQGGSTYQMHVYQEIKTDNAPNMAVITESGNTIPYQELTTENGGLSFTLPPGETSAVICFYNPYSYEISGLLWIDKPSAYKSLVSLDSYPNFHINMDNVSSNISIWGSNNNYIKMASSNGRLYVSSQIESTNGRYSWTENGTAWTSVDANTLVDTDVTALSPSIVGISDICSDSGFLFMGTFYLYSSVASYFGYSLSIADNRGGTSAYNLDASHSNSNNYVTSDTVPFRNSRISHSGTHIALASIDSSNSNLYIRMAPVSPGIIGTYSTAVSGNFDTGTTADNLDIACIDNSCYIIGDSGSVYRYDYNASSVSLSPVFSVPSSTNTYRHLGVFNDKYLVASSPDYSKIFIPETKRAITFYDKNSPPQEVVDLTSKGYTIDYHLFASKGYLISVLKINISGESMGIAVSMSQDGGFSWVQSAPVLLTSTSLNVLDVDIDETLNECYVSAVIDEGNLTYRIFSFKLQ